MLQMTLSWIQRFFTFQIDFDILQAGCGLIWWETSVVTEVTICVWPLPLSEWFLGALP